MEVGAVSGSFLGDTVGSAQMFKGMSEVGALQGTRAHVDAHHSSQKPGYLLADVVLHRIMMNMHTSG